MQSIWQDVVDLEPPIDSAVDFPTRTRFHMALNVKDVEQLLPFYRTLLGTDPTLVRDGYAKFELRDPPLHLSLNRVQHNARGHGRFGIEARTAEFARAAYDRVAGSVFRQGAERVGAAEHTFMVVDPEANRWRVGPPQPTTRERL